MLRSLLLLKLLQNCLVVVLRLDGGGVAPERMGVTPQGVGPCHVDGLVNG